MDNLGPKYRESTSARMRRKKPVERSRPPAVGERKALRKRLVLSNTNALEVQGMQDLSVETMVDSRLRGAVLGLPMEMLHQMKAAQAFKPTQGWFLFRRPGIVLRRETLEMGRLFERIGTGDEKGKVVKKVITGVRGSGKSVHLLQAIAMGFLKRWIVITVPEGKILPNYFSAVWVDINYLIAQDLVIANTSYGSLGNSEPAQYVQNDATAALLSRIAITNKEVLSELHLSRSHPALGASLRPNMSLEDLARLGGRDPSIAWPVFLALWTELTAAESVRDSGTPNPFKPRPPMLVTVDGLAHWMMDSKYRNAQFKPIHAHDLAFVNHFLSLLRPGEPKPVFPNGGLLLYATSASNNPTVPTFDFVLKQLAARQEGINPLSPQFPRTDPYAGFDERVLELFNAASQGKLANESPTEVQRLGGLTRDETRGFMEYFARSGLLRERVTEEWVGEKWSLAGGGIIGEMEKLGRRLRVAA
jgi:small subunit ribosomal protein S29